MAKGSGRIIRFFGSVGQKVQSTKVLESCSG